MGYTTDLTHRQRNYIFENFPEIFKTKSKSDIFEILNALFFLIKTGCQWKLLPNDFPKWRTVYEFYRKWISIGFFDRLTREQYLYAAKELQWWRVRCLCCGSSDSAPSPIHHKHLFSQLSVAQVTIAPANRHASASACFGHNATALLPHCANKSARRLTAPALTNIGERGLSLLQTSAASAATSAIANDEDMS